MPPEKLHIFMAKQEGNMIEIVDQFIPVRGLDLNDERGVLNVTASLGNLRQIRQYNKDFDDGSQEGIGRQKPKRQKTFEDSRESEEMRDTISDADDMELHSISEADEAAEEADQTSNRNPKAGKPKKNMRGVNERSNNNQTNNQNNHSNQRIGSDKMDDDKFKQEEQRDPNIRPNNPRPQPAIDKGSADNRITKPASNSRLPDHENSKRTHESSKKNRENLPSSNKIPTLPILGNDRDRQPSNLPSKPDLPRQLSRSDSRKPKETSVIVGTANRRRTSSS